MKSLRIKKIGFALVVGLCSSASVLGQVYVGAAYYPEQVDSAQIEKDAKMMQDAHLNVVRMGDFAWHCMEPHDGTFTLKWLDYSIRTLYKYGVKTLLCTPTAAIPKWMCDAHPEIMQVNADGWRKPYGRRRHACLDTREYQKYCIRIAQTLASRYKDNLAVIGFQIDNELGTEDPYCYCSECKKAFQSWLEGKYRTIAALNKAWGTTFWSETLDDFNQVWLPHKMDSPAIYLDFQRFSSDRIIRFFKMQRDAIKNIAPRMLVTTNVGSSGFVTAMDLYQLADACDVLSMDNYPINGTLENLYNNNTGQPFDPSMTSFAMQIIRGGKQRTFWVTEEQIGRTGLLQREIVKDGYPRLWTHQQFGYGCLLSSFFPFRAFQYGHENIMAGIVESDYVERDKYYEVQQTALELQKIYAKTGELLPIAKAAVIRDFQVDWTHENGYTFSPDLKYLREIYKYYRALRSQSVMTDVVSSQADLSPYKLIVVPYLSIASNGFCQRLEQAAKRGATIVLTCMSGIRDANLQKTDGLMSKSLQKLAGIEIEGQEALIGSKSNTMVYNDSLGLCRYWFDKVKLTGAATMATFNGNYFSGKPAITCHAYGQGKVYYIATVLEQKVTDKMMKDIVGVSSLSPLARCSEPLVDISELRARNGKRYVYVVNFSNEEQKITLKEPMADIMTGKKYQNQVSVKASDYLLLQVIH
jgi:beta-galactosidase